MQLILLITKCEDKIKKNFPHHALQRYKAIVCAQNEMIAASESRLPKCHTRVTYACRVNASKEVDVCREDADAGGCFIASPPTGAGSTSELRSPSTSD